MPTGLTQDAGWQIGVSRTLPHPLETVWALLASSAGLAVWLGELDGLPEHPGATLRTTEGHTGELRSLRLHDRIRLRWRPADRDADTTLQVAMQDRGGRTLLRFHQEHLADAEERELQRTHWRAVMDELEAMLDA